MCFYYKPCASACWTQKVFKSMTQVSEFLFFWEELRQIPRWFLFRRFLFRGYVLYIHTYIDTYIRAYIYTRVHTYMHTHTHTQTHIRTSKHKHTHTHQPQHVFMYVCCVHFGSALDLCAQCSWQNNHLSLFLSLSLFLCLSLLLFHLPVLVSLFV